MPDRSAFSRALLLALALGTALLAVPAPRPARAQLAVVCANCATWTQQLTSYAKEVEQVAETITMRINQATMLQNQVRNMASLPGQVWNQIEGNFAQTQSLFQRGTQLMNNAGMVSANLQSYRSVLGQTIDMPAQYARWSQQANDNVAATLSGFGLMRDQMTGDRAVVDAIRARSAGADGAVRAIQASTEMAGAQVNELHRLREIMLEDARMNANALQIAADRQAVGDADMTRFMARPAPAITGGRQF